VRILVTGATGRIGANLVRELVARGNEVRAFALPDDPKLRKLDGAGADVILGDLLDSEAVKKACDGVEYVAHLGYIMGKPAGMSTATEFDINMRGTFNVLEAAASQKQIRRFLFASTNATYDAFHPKYVPIDELHPQSPHSYYGMEKLAGERMTESYGRMFGLLWTIVRFGTVPGPDELLMRLSSADVANYLREFAGDPTSQLYAPGIDRPSAAVERAIDEGTEYVIPIGANGKSWMQDLVDVRDTVQGIILAMTHDNGKDETFNITGFGVTWEEALTHLAMRTGVKCPKIELPNTWYWRCDNSKAKSRIGYMPQYTIDRMIDDALAFERGEDIGVLPSS
jgi:nucleoside-diphosphate-sugar epimerase